MVPVTVTNARATNIPVQLTAIGTVHAYSTVSVKSENKGQLAHVGFKQGDEVQAGDLIFVIDPKPYQAALNQTQANFTRDLALLVKAEADLRRDSDLFTNSIISRADYDLGLATVDSLKGTLQADAAAITNAEVQLSYCYIKSPVSGRIGTLLINEGNMVKDIDTVLVVINQMKPIYVDASIPELNLQVVRDHMRGGHLRVEATIPGYAGRQAEGRLLFVDNQVDLTTGTILLRSEFPNADEMLWPGQFVNVALTLTVERSAIVVPSSAIQLAQEGQSVCVVKPDDTVEFRPVELGNAYGTLTVVKKGLEAGEQVITSGQLQLAPGTKVRIVTAEMGAGTGPEGA
jgi:membrane fusion protein, multidrug efflux system